MGKHFFNTFTIIVLSLLLSIGTLRGQGCYPPDYSEVLDVTGTTATLYWEDYNGNNAWNIILSTTELEDPNTSGVTATVTGSQEVVTYNAQGLTPETDYYYYIQAHCGTNNNSDWIDGTFRTRCADSGIPYNNNFNNYTPSQTSFPDCWTKIQGTAYASTSDATHGTVLRLNNYTAVATPSFTAPVNTLRVQFAIWASSTSTQLEVGVIDNLDDWETYTAVETITFDASFTFYERTVNLNTYTGNGRYIVFYSTGGGYLYIDDLTVGVIPNCINPVNVAVSSVSANSAALTWSEAGNATQWRVLLSQNPITNFNTQSPITCNSTSYNANSLASNTTYYFYVQSVCTGENSEWSSLTFTTLCSAASLPASESFTVNQTPGCWAKERVTGNADVTFVAYSTLPDCHPAAGSAMVKWSSASINAGWQGRLISLPLNTSGTSALDVNFKWNHDLENSGGLGDGVQIQYSTDGVTWTNSTQGLIPRYDGLQNGWTEYDVILPEAGNRPVVYVGFLFNTGNAGSNCYLDEVTFRAASGCFVPVNIEVSNIGGNSATITWDEVGSANSWELLLSEAPITNFANVSPITLNSTTYNAINLSPATDYYVYVRSKCSGNSYSGWTSAKRFTTGCGVVLELPFIESFDNYGTCTNAFPPCWVRHGQPSLGNFYHNGQYCTTPSATDLDAVDGDKSLLVCTPSGSFTYTITPAFQEDIRNLAVTFFLKKSSAQYSGTFEVGVMSDPNDLASFESIATVSPANVGEWVYYPISLANASLSGSGNRIAFRHHGDIDDCYYLLDAVSVMLIPDCWPATLLTASNVTGNSATLSWVDPNEPAAQWRVKVADYPMNDMSQSANVYDQTVGGSPVTIDYLTGGLTYHYYVQSVCGGSSTGDWLHGTFTTLPCNCYVDIYMNDAYSNGWEGAKIQLKHGTTVFAEATMADGAHDTVRIYTCEASNIDYYFVSGSYDSDISFTIVNSLGTTVYSTNGTPVGGCFTSGTPACGVSCNAAPTGLTATATANGSSLTWTGTPNALTYTVYRNNSMIADYITTTSYIDPNPAVGNNCYTVTAQCIVGESNPSNESCTTGIDELNADHAISIFPNPANDKFTVSADFPFVRISVVNLLGQEVIRQDVVGNRTEISVSELPAGIYLVKVLDGKNWIVRKIIVE